MNKITGVVVGQIGQAIPLAIVDADGVAYDLSAYTAALFRSISPDAQTTLNITASITSATGGLVSFTPTSDAFFTRDGLWESQIQFSDTGILRITVPFQFDVSKQI
jgi:hypothetical protein